MIKTHITLFLILSSLTIFAQRFDIISAEFDNETIQVEGEVFIDLSKKSIASKINNKEMTFNKLTLRKGDLGELLCFKESIEVKQRFKFPPNKTGQVIWLKYLIS